MLNKILIFILVISLNSAKAQYLGVFEDYQKKFYIFDTDHFYKAEYMPVQQYWLGKKYVAYIANNGRFYMYFNGEKHEVASVPVKVQATDNYLSYFIDEQLWVFNGEQIKFIEPWVKTLKTNTEVRIFPSFTISDNILAFTNSFERFYVYEDTIKEQELWDIKHIKSGDNLVAYIDNNDYFKVVYNKNKIELEDIAPLSFICSKNIVAYVDDYETFKIWYKGTLTEIQNTKPQKYYAAENMIAYTNEMDEFVCFYDGVIYDVLPYEPSVVVMKDNFLVYTNSKNYTYAFYKGKNYKISSYLSKNIFIEDDFIVFQDLDGYLKGFKNGEIVAISEEIVIEFNVFNDVVVYKPNEYTWKAYYNGKVIQYYP